MTPAEFKKKWAKVSAKESAAYQSHFDDLCRMLGHPTPLEADPTGDEWFCFQKGVIKNLGDLDHAGATKPKKGCADVWKKGCFGWEYKGQHKDLDEAFDQLKLYREALLNPPLLVVCDFDRFIIQTNFNGTAPATHEFRNSQIDDPQFFKLLRDVFTDPDFLKPQRTTAEVTEKLAQQIAGVAKSLQQRESRELADAQTRAALNFSQRKNLRIASMIGFDDGSEQQRVLDAAVAAAYGWPAALSDDEILTRLLALNHTRAAAAQAPSAAPRKRALREKHADEML